MHSKNTTPAPSRPCRRFVRLSRHSRARTHPAAENQTLRRRAGALAKNARIGKKGSGESRLRQMQENAENGQNRGILDAAARKRRESRTKLRGRARLRSGHNCPPCGQFRGFTRAFQKAQKSAMGCCRMKKARRFKEYSGVPTKDTR